MTARQLGTSASVIDPLIAFWDHNGSADMEKLVGQEIRCRIIKLDVDEEDVVLDRRTVLEADFGGRAVNEQNLSEWKQGGFAEWQRHQMDREWARVLAEESEELNEDGGSVPAAERLAAPVALALAQLLRESAALDADQHLFEPVYLSADAQEGPRAFAEKRAPVWQGRYAGCGGPTRAPPAQQSAGRPPANGIRTLGGTPKAGARAGGEGRRACRALGSDSKADLPRT